MRHYDRPERRLPLHLIIAAAALSIPAAARAAAPAVTTPPALAAQFTLALGAGDEAQRSAGTLAFLADGSICVRVESPLRQELLLERERLVIYYPDEDLALENPVRRGTAPPMLEAILAAMVDPASTLPADSKLLEQRREGDKLVSRWKLVAKGGQDVGELRSVEARDGVTEVVLADADGKVQRRFVFGARVRVAGRSLAQIIDATWLDRTGEIAREEHWRLSAAKPLELADPAVAVCARKTPKTKVKEIGK